MGRPKERSLRQMTSKFSSEYRNNSRTISSVAYIAFAIFCLGGCVPNMVLRVQNSAGPSGPLQRCPADNGACSTDPNQDLSRFNNAGTRSFTLPACPNGIDSILIEGGNAAIVQCAAPNQPTGASTDTTTTPSSGGAGAPSTATVTNP